FLIVRHNRAFTLIAADEPVPDSQIPRLSHIDDLHKHANSELVSLYYSLKTLNANDFSTQVKRMMGPFGDVYAISPTNTPYMKDEVATLKQIVAMIESCESVVNRAEMLSYKCEFIPARDAEHRLKEFLGDPARSLTDGVNPVMVTSGMLNVPPGGNAPIPA